MKPPKPITVKDLKPFQTQAAGTLAGLIQEFPSARLRRKFDPETGEPLPFLCRLRAITGAGKTPILALAARQLGDAVILWTTNRGAVIAQTKANLLPGGKYADLLSEETVVHEIAGMGPQDWTEATQSTQGLTILLATVASFNQDGDKLRIHQDRNGTTYWKMLGGQGEEGRKRPLYVFYDEGHGATDRQFRRLRELGPKAFVLASASPLPDDFKDLLPGRTEEEQNASLEMRTIAVPTPEVVAMGLLKTRLYLMDCNIGMADAVAEANGRWKALAAKFRTLGGEMPIACFIVNETTRGLDVWEQLVGLGVPSNRIAVHLSGAEALMMERRGASNGLIDTLKAKKEPEDLKNEGYTHLIWNLSLREGWDEPMAYVAYIDDKGKSVTDMTQKIGRFVRQPDATPFDDPDLNSAYFYFNVSDQEFESLIRNMQAEMTVDGYEVIAMKSDARPKTSRLAAVKGEKTVPEFREHFGNDAERVDNIILAKTPSFSEEALRAEGLVDTRVFDVERLEEDMALRRREEREENASVTAYEFITSRLTSMDGRIKNYISGTLRGEKKMKQRLQFGSEAMTQMQSYVGTMRDALNDEFRLTSKGRHGLYAVKPFNLVSPDITGVSDVLRERYHVRTYQNAVHEEYNGLNPFEVRVAEALDTLDLTWCRNPSKTGYGIPIAALGASVENFYPDFLLWTGTAIWAIDPKGEHLKEAAVQNKLYDVTGVVGVSIPVKVALILEGAHDITTEGVWKSSKKEGGYTLVRRTTAGVRTRQSQDLRELLAAMIDE